MKNTFLLFLLIIVSYSFLSAQNSESYKLYKMESIYLKGNKFVKNDVAYPIGFLGANLANEMRVSEHSIIEWNKYVNNRNWSMVTSISSLGLIVASYRFRDNSNLSSGLLLGGLTLSIISIPISMKANNQIQKAVWTRNRDLLVY